MKHVLKTCCVFLVLAAMCVSLVGCGRDIDALPTMPPDTNIVPEGNVKFTCSISKLVEEQAADAFIEAFTEKYPDVTVTKDYNPGNIPARIASGEIGDVFHFNETEAYNYAITQKALLPLNQFIDPLDIDTSKVYTGILALGQVEGQLYMVPKDYNHIVMIYNKTALNAANLEAPKDGWTWEEFKDYCTKLTTMDGDVYTQVGGHLNYGWDPVYVSFLEGWGGKWYDTEEKKITLTDELVRKGIEELLSFAATGAIKPEGKGDMSAYTGLQDVNYVFRTMVYPNIVSYGQAYDDLDLDWDLVSFPKLPTHKVGTGASGFGVYKYTKNANAAAALALFFFTTEGQQAYHGTTGGSVPLVQELADAGFWRYEASKGTDADWSEKNFNAFVSFPEADTVGRVNCVMPARVASVITGSWGGMVAEYFNSGDYLNPLTKMQETANQTWDRIINSLS
ncbi:MAG: carbohydrate ABC transporter substrate-binding protein [Ruminococcaceae bacterium]|nr:carbohydrate ABC transporter substrate-binding protein [Oscillospiraceae bacterium]